MLILVMKRVIARFSDAHSSTGAIGHANDLATPPVNNKLVSNSLSPNSVTCFILTDETSHFHLCYSCRLNCSDNPVQVFLKNITLNFPRFRTFLLREEINSHDVACKNRVTFRMFAAVGRSKWCC